jgi:hypothetical protein
MKNSHKIKSLHENLSAKVDAIKGLVKHCEMMNNQVEQMISLHNQLYENLIGKKQVRGVNTRGGASTQDPGFPDGHPKRREQDALKKKSSAGKSPNENDDNGNSKEQVKDTSISDVEAEDNNNENEDDELIPRDEEQQDAKKNEESMSPTREDPQPSIEKNKKKKHPSPQKGKGRDPWVRRPIPYPQEVMKSMDDARFEKFLELIKKLCLQIPLVDAIKIPPYSKYMKDIVTNKIKIPNDAIIAMLASYSFKGKLPK